MKSRFDWNFITKLKLGLEMWLLGQGAYCTRSPGFDPPALHKIGWERSAWIT